jgi:hypothetical protein
MAREYLITRWLAIFAWGHSAGGPDALHDAGALARAPRMAMLFVLRRSRRLAGGKNETVLKGQGNPAFLQDARIRLARDQTLACLAHFLCRFATPLYSRYIKRVNP